MHQRSRARSLLAVGAEGETDSHERLGEGAGLLGLEGRSAFAVNHGWAWTVNHLDFDCPCFYVD